MKKTYFILAIVIVLASCSIEPTKIEYGIDACHFCQMTIVEKTHAAQIVTKKGRSYKYDAVECMLNDLEHRDLNKIELFFVTDYLNPSNLIDAKTATYLISSAVKSPMGANLSAFKMKEDAKAFVKNNVDKIYSWNALQTHWQ